MASEAFDPTLAPTPGKPMVLTGIDNKFRLISDEYCAFLMRSREELLNVDWTSIAHPDDIANPSAKQARLLATGEPYDVCVRVLRGDGHWLPIQFRASLAERQNGPPLIQGSAWLKTSVQALDDVQTTAGERERAAVAEYIQIVSAELTKMADREGLKFLQHLLAMASLEAAQETHKLFGDLVPSATSFLN